MNNRISEYLKSLGDRLSDLPEDEKSNILNYYEEYLYDASDSGKDLDEVINGLGSAEEVASMVNAEFQLQDARKNPSVKSFNKAMTHVFRGVATPMGYFLRGIFLIVGYALIVTVMLGALTAFISALAFPAMMLFEAVTLRTSFIAEFIGSIGAALLIFGIFSLAGLGLFALGRTLVQTAAGMLSWMLHRNKNKESYTEQASSKKVSKQLEKKLYAVALAGLAAGLVLFFASGLPVKYFVIFNSMKPDNVQTVSKTYDIGEVTKISVLTAQSCIRVVPSDDGKLRVTYEQPDWLQGELHVTDGVLEFKETSNGRLPLFDIATLHESRTQVTLYIPKNYDPELITLESKGGIISIDNVAANINAKTYTGEITLHEDIPIHIAASTEVGAIEVGGRPAGERNARGISFALGADTLKHIVLTTSRGQIVIR
ncbi:MAG: DUF1700 domain-containing protein [Clostridia bacterium]|nr:DUF1700 domain-containing protein [Clostridia bacterium]